MNKKFVIKNSKGQYFTMCGHGMAATPHFPEALQYTNATAALMAVAYNQKYGDDMAVTDADREAMTYYPKNIYHAFDEGDALRTAQRVKNGKYVQYCDATPICIKGIWFVYARECEKEVTP